VVMASASVVVRDLPGRPGVVFSDFRGLGVLRRMHLVTCELFAVENSKDAQGVLFWVPRSAISFGRTCVADVMWGPWSLRGCRVPGNEPYLHIASLMDKGLVELENEDLECAVLVEDLCRFYG
jgi:hypothetical protein